MKKDQIIQETQVTLVDVAKAAGVSRGTASNVFNNPDIVRKVLREKVEAAARSLGYLGPDPRARVLRAGKINSIGVIPPAELGIADALRNPVFAAFVQGVGETCDKRGANLVIIPDKPRQEGTRSALVDGFVFGRIEHLEMLKTAQLRKLPYAVVDFNAGSSINSVMVDTRRGCAEAAQHLLDLGHRKFAIVSFLRSARPARLYPGSRSRPVQLEGTLVDQEKLQGYADALGRVGISVDDVPIVEASPWDPDAAALLLDAAPQATAILSMSVMQGIAIAREARRRNIRVPEELSIVGYNDIPEALNCDPPITTIDSLNVEKGRIAAEMVLSRSPPSQVVLHTQLIIRGSTAPAPR